MVPNAYLKKALIGDHREIRLHPYLPSAWIGRAATLLALGYAELAVADAYRACLLVKELNLAVENNTGHRDSVAASVMMAFLDSHGRSKGSNDDIIDQMASGYRQATLLVVQGLNCLEAYEDAVYTLEHYLEGIPNEPSFTILLKETRERLQERKRILWEQLQDTTATETAAMRGQVHRTAYPWIVAGEIDRSSAATKRLKAKFKDASHNAAVAPSSLGSGESNENLGVFATQKIRKGEQILRNKSIFAVRNVAPGGNCGHNSCKNNYCAADHCGACCLTLFGKGIAAGCCSIGFCSEECKADALSSYHKILCGKDFSEIYQSGGATNPENDGVPLVMLKVLATAVQQKVKPLKVPCVAALKADYDTQIPSPFSVQENIIGPAHVLQTMGVDIFTDPRFDPWALQTLFLRIQNNKQIALVGKSLDVGVSPLLSIFNHDCDPAAAWEAQDGGIGGPVNVVALRDIEEGEEICVSYTLASLSEAERRGRVEGYIGKRCECARCVRERKQEADKEFTPATSSALLGL